MDQESPKPRAATCANPNDDGRSHHDAGGSPPVVRQSPAPERWTIRDYVQEVTDHFVKMYVYRDAFENPVTSFRNLDQLVDSLKPGKTLVISPCPGMGKISLMLNIVKRICLDQKVPTLIFSGESTAFHMVQRIVFSRAGYGVNRLIYQDFYGNKNELMRLAEAAREIAKSSLFIVDSSGISLNELRAAAVRHKLENNIGFIAIDNLYQLRPDSPLTEQSEESEVAEVAAGIKSLARELKIPILVLC